MSSFDLLLDVISEEVGLSIEKIRDYCPDELRDYLEQKNHKKLEFISEFPVIGRGSPIREFETTEELDKEIATILQG